jgi:hypothetical protein
VTRAYPTTYRWFMVRCLARMVFGPVCAIVKMMRGNK